MIKKFETELQRIHTIVQSIPEAKRKRVYFEAIHSRMRTFSPDSIAIFALQSAGGINVARDAQVRHDTNIADYGKERILAKAKDIDVFLAQKGTMNRTTIQQLREEPGFPAIKAIQDKQIYIIDEKIVSRPTLRLLDGIYEIGRFLYPEQFNDVHDLMGVRTLSRAQFATMFCKLTNMPLKTPDYRQDIQKRTGSKHRYGEFADVDYATESYKFIETAVFRGLFSDSDQLTFSPEQPMTRAALAYSLFVYFDLPENDKVVTLKDVTDSSPNYEQTQTAVGLGLMNTMQDGLFNPQGTISGEEVFQIVNKAKSLSAAPQKQ
jgi:iron complex transport system substrate-binding protein